MTGFLFFVFIVFLAGFFTTLLRRPRRRKFTGNKALRPLAQERRVVAIHEAGHVVMARFFGIEGKAMIAKTSAYYWGLTKFNKQLYALSRGVASYPPKELSADFFEHSMDEKIKLIAIAGATAESVWARRFGHYDRFLDIGRGMLDPISPSDYRSADFSSFADLETFIAIARDILENDLFDQLVVEARRLIEESKDKSLDKIRKQFFRGFAKLNNASGNSNQLQPLER